MWELTKRISLRILSDLSKVEPEPDPYTGSYSDQKVPAPQHLPFTDPVIVTRHVNWTVPFIVTKHVNWTVPK